MAREYSEKNCIVSGKQPYRLQNIVTGVTLRNPMLLEAGRMTPSQRLKQVLPLPIVAIAIASSQTRQDVRSGRVGLQVRSVDMSRGHADRDVLGRLPSTVSVRESHLLTSTYIALPASSWREYSVIASEVPRRCCEMSPKAKLTDAKQL